MLKEKALCSTRTSPIRPAAMISFTFRHCGWQRYMNASIQNTSLPSTTSSTCSNSAALTIAGFSHRMCFPASAHLMLHSPCR